MTSISHTSQGETSTSPTALLDAAATRLAWKIEAALPQTGKLAVADALSELQVLVRSVGAILSGEDVAGATTTLLRPTLHARLIEALRSEVVTPPVRPEQVQPSLAVVRALQAAQETLWGEGNHDLRERLTQPDAFELSQLGLIYSAALGLASVASDIVDLAQNGKGLVESEPEAYSLGEVFRGVVDLVGPMADEKQVELRVKVPDFEQAYGHPIALGRILLNLTTNALKFTDQGYVEIGVTRKSRSDIEFYVRDTGRGISAEQQRELFQPFKKRSERDGHYFSGSGVGLTIARRLTRSLGSELLLDTAPDWGTRFYFVVEAPPIQ
jgi:signal transduction histidine kinase